MTSRVATAPVVGSDRPAARPPRRRLRISLAIIGSGVAAFAILCVVDGLRVARDVRAGRASFARLASEDLSSERSLSSLARDGAARFEHAWSIARGSPWLRAWSRVPVFGRPARWLRAAATTTTSVSRAAADAIARIEPYLHAAGPAARLELLDVVAEEFTRLRHVLAAVRLPATGGFLPPIDAAGRRLGEDLRRLRADLAGGVTAARGLRSFLSGPTTYLVLAANNAEMRAGGMVLQAGLMRTAGGTASAGGFRSTGDLLLRPAAPVPEQVRGLYGWLRPGMDWRNLGSSPNFPAVAPVYAAMAKRSGPGDVDGVLDIDVLGLRALLEATGPVTVGGRRFDSRNVERLVMHDLYVSYKDDRNERVQQFSDLASTVFRAFAERPWRPADLARALRSAAAGRHIIAWSSRSIEQAAWASLGLDGSLQRDGLMLTVQNHTGNKLDWFLRPSMLLRIEERRGAWRRAHLTITIANPTPEGEPLSVAGDGILVPPGAYRALVAVYLPGWATNVEIPGRTVALVGPDGPSRVVGTRIDVGRGATVTLEVAFSVPPQIDSIVLMPSSRAAPVPLRFGELRTDDAAPRVVAL